MKILQIIYNLASGGAERFVVDLCNELATKNNNEVHLLTTNDDAIRGNKHYHDLLSEKVVYHNIGAKSGFSLKSIIGVYKAINRIKPDIVHLHSNLVLFFLPAFLCKKTKLIHTLHNVAEKTVTIKQLKPIYKQLYKKRITPITISNVCNESYKEYYGLSNSICINNGRTPVSVTTSYNEIEKEVQGYLRQSDTPVYIHVARYAEQKNQKLLFDTFTRLHDEGEKFLLLVLGANFENSPYMELNKTDYIKILGAKQNVADYLACSDYFVLSSSWEGLPISLLEAMSIGCIPVSTPAGGVVDVIKNGKNGLLCQSFDEEEFYKTVKSTFTNKKSIQKSDIIDDYNKNYTMEVCASKYYKVYCDTLGTSLKK